MAKYIGINYREYSVAYDEYPNEAEAEKYFRRRSDITHIVMVHCETTTGILNPIEIDFKSGKGIWKNVNH